MYIYYNIVYIYIDHNICMYVFAQNGIPIVYMVHLANNKFGELGCNVHWWRFQFGEQGDVECTLFITPRLHNNRGGGECPTLYTTAKHTALSYDTIRC